MPKYKTAAQLGILPAERTALIAFATAPALGRTIAVNGKAHYYDQSYAEDSGDAAKNHCGTAGCVAGFVFAHARAVQRKRTLRGARLADDYIAAACADEVVDDTYTSITPLLDKLYQDDSGSRTLSEAKRVVDRMLRAGKVMWR